MKRIYEYEDLQPVLEQLLADKESSDLEFKSAKGGFPHSFWETYSSLANTDGGAIVFGIKEKDDQFYLDGVTEEQAKKYEKDFFNRMHSKESVNIPLLKENDVQTVKFDGVYFLFFYIPRVDRSLRPVYCGLDPYTGTYRRDLDCRNKYLQTMFTFLGSAEKAGSGVDKIIRGWEELNWKRPYLVEKKRPNKVVLTLSMESLLDESVKEGLSKLYGDRIADISQEQLLTLALAYSEEEITNERLQYALNMHKADITKMLGQMCAAHLLESSGHGRGTKYHVYGLNIGLQDANIGLQDTNIGLPKKRYSKEEMKNLIVTYCNDWRTAEEIAIYVGRKFMYIRDIVLPQLSDVIEKMYDIPHHPRQKYRAKQMEADA